MSPLAHRQEPPTDVGSAVRFLLRLRLNDPVLVSTDSSPDRVLAMRVSVAAHRCDGAFGSPESTRVTVSLGTGRYSTEVVADRMIERRGLPRRFRIEIDSWQWILDRLVEATTLQELDHVVTDHRRCGAWAAEHDALFELRALELCDDQAVIAAIAGRVRADLGALEARPSDDTDRVNARSHDSLVAGWTLLLDWLAGRTLLPASWQDWPCAACFAEPGEPCDIPDRYRRDKSLPDDRDALHHLCRGLDGRWASCCVGSAA